MSLGKYIKTVRRRRGLSQWELSRLSGLTRSHLSRLELDNFESPSAETFLSLAKALKVHPNDLYQAAGYIEENSRFRRETTKNADEAFAELDKLALVPVPVLPGAQADLVDSIQSSPRGLSVEDESHIIGLYARGFSMEPDVLEGDVIFIDREKRPVQDSILLGFQDHQMQLLRYQQKPADYRVIDDSFSIFGVVVGINRRFN
jgi:transcriptional regulator with XRE-family HTH domain